MKKIFSTLVLLISSFCLPSGAVAVPLDYDSDLRSNLSAVKINSDSSLSWMYQSDSQGMIEDLSAFGVAGNHLMPGFYVASQTIQGIVSEDGRWRFANGVKRNFGSDSALYLGGADYDGDGLSDIAYATNVCLQKKSNFHSMLNPTQSNVQSEEIPVGRGNQYKFFYDVNSDGTDEICFLRPMKRAGQLTIKFRAVCKNGTSGQRVKAVRLGRVFEQPQVLRSKNNEDFILLTRSRASKTKIRLLNASGRAFFKHTFDETGTIVVGNFSTDEIEEIALVQDSGAFLLNPLARSERSVSPPGGIPYDLNNIEHFSADKNCFCTTQTIKKFGNCSGDSNSGDNDSGDGGQNDGDNGSFYIPDNCGNPPDHISWNDGFKCIPSDTRGGSVVCLLPYQFTWAPHRSTTDHHGYTFACNANDDHFSKVELVLNGGQRIGLSYSGCHNYVGTTQGPIGRQHFRNESVKWSNISGAVQRIEMTRGGQKTCLRF